MDAKLVRLAEELREYYSDRLWDMEYIDELNESVIGRPVSYPGL